MGAAMSASVAIRGRRSSIPMASRVPITVEMRVAAKAMNSELPTAAMIFSLAKSSPYQCSESPVQTLGMPALLKESATSTRIGP